MPSSKLDSLENLASISSLSYEFTKRSVSPFKVVSLATEPPWNDQSGLSFLKFDFLTKLPDSVGWGKHHLNTNTSEIRQWRTALRGESTEVTSLSITCQPPSAPPSSTNWQREISLEVAIFVAENRWGWFLKWIDYHKDIFWATVGRQGVGGRQQAHEMNSPCDCSTLLICRLK